MEQIIYYPENKKIKGIDNAAVRIYGNRFHVDQTLYEYLNEFLLIFVSAKSENNDGIMQFHDENKLEYYVKPRMAFRRFVFYERAKKDKFVKIDDEAYKLTKKVLKQNIDGESDEAKENFLLALQDLFYGYASVLKKRHWCAQSLLPLCPEMILCEEMPLTQKRIKGMPDSYTVTDGYDAENTFCESEFDHQRHNFMARGGELYYLHILQYLDTNKEEKETLEKLLVHLLTTSSEDFSSMVNWIQGTCENCFKIDPKMLTKRMYIGCIPTDGYRRSGKFATEELASYLMNTLNPVKKIDVLAKGIMLQIMRMMCERTANYLKIERKPWIIDMRSKKSGNLVKRLAAKSFDVICDDFATAITKNLSENGEDGNSVDVYQSFVKARKETIDIFKSKGKELQCIIPSNGANERFSLSEDIIRFLVLALVKPGRKMDLDTFLAKLYEHYGFVIGPNEFSKCNVNYNLSKELTETFNYNKESFQNFLKATGFLRDLSDATSIVVNPYDEVNLE